MISRLSAPLATLAVLAACAPADPDTVFSSAPNPAAAYCASVGGTYGLEAGTCTLPGGDVVDAWDYYRAAFA